MLDRRERRIFEARRLAETPLTLEELAEEFGVSRERVRQIEVRAFERVEKAVRNRVAALEQPAAGAGAASRLGAAGSAGHALMPARVRLDEWKIRCWRCRMAGRTIPAWTGNPTAGACRPGRWRVKPRPPGPS